MTSRWRELWAFRNIIIFILTPILLLPLPLLDQTSKAKCAYVLILMGVYWCTEAIPLAVTGFIPLLLLPTLGILSTKIVVTHYVKDATILIICGAIMASAVERWNLHRRIALRVLMLFGSQPRWLMLGMMIPTWFLSMWISNTATACMMIPIIDAILEQLRDTHVEAKFQLDCECGEMQNVVNDEHVTSKEGSECIGKRQEADIAYEETEEEDVADSPFSSEQGYRNLCKAMSLCVCYAANVGGIGTVIGSGTSLVLLGFSDSLFAQYGLENPLMFTTWMVMAVPTSALNLLVTWVWLQVYFFKWRCRPMITKAQDRAIKALIRSEYNSLGRMSFAEWAVLVHFLVLALLWLFRKPQFVTGWDDALFLGGMVSDAVPAVLICTLLFVFPARLPNTFCWRRSGDTSEPRLDPLLDWDTVHRQVPWKIVWLLGGGFALGAGFQESGLSFWIGDKLSALDGMEPWAIRLILTFAAASVTQFTSNMVVATIILPILQQLGLSLGVNPLYLMFPVIIATSFAFMLPVATPPNAIVYAHGKVSVLDMVKAGAMLNILCILVLNVAASTWCEAFFKFSVIPDAMATAMHNVTSSRT